MRRILSVTALLAALGLCACVTTPTPPTVFSDRWMTEVRENERQKQDKQTREDIVLFNEGEPGETAVRFGSTGTPKLTIGEKGAVRVEGGRKGVQVNYGWEWKWKRPERASGKAPD